jgi:hypothetical protein
MTDAQQKENRAIENLELREEMLEEVTGGVGGIPGAIRGAFNNVRFTFANEKAANGIVSAVKTIPGAIKDGFKIGKHFG